MDTCKIGILVLGNKRQMQIVEDNISTGCHIHANLPGWRHAVLFCWPIKDALHCLQSPACYFWNGRGVFFVRHARG